MNHMTFLRTIMPPRSLYLEATHRSVIAKERSDCGNLNPFAVDPGLIFGRSVQQARGALAIIKTSAT